MSHPRFFPLSLRREVFNSFRKQNYAETTTTRCFHQHHRASATPKNVHSPSPSPSRSRSCLRPFTTTSRHLYKTVEEARSRKISGPFSVRAALLFLVFGGGMLYYFQYEKERMKRLKIAEASKGVGRPKVGGKFELVDHEGRRFGDEDMKGGFTLVYFGFTHCPDICPDELDKMTRMIDLVSPSDPSDPSFTPSSTISSTTLPPPPPPSSSSPTSPIPRPPRPPLLPLVITCDPARDTPAVLKSYLAEFHPAMLGLTGTWEQIKQVCKAYRVYFSTPEGVKPGMDYLVDHIIYFYLMDPEGDFIEAIGRQHTAQQAAKIIAEHMSDWKGAVKKK